MVDPTAIFRHLPPNRVGATDRAYMNEVLDAGFSNVKDPADISARLEIAFAKKFGVGFAISHNSGSGTMLTALIAAGVGPGDEVIIPTHTAAPTAFVVVECGAVPVFSDSDADTFCIDPADIERKITEHTKAIIPVSIYGLSPDYDRIMNLAKQHDLVVIEDNAQCFLGYYKDKLVGTIGHCASFSFQGSKHMTSGGDGGITITDDEDYAREIRKIGHQGFRTLSGRAGEGNVAREVRQDWAFERHDRLGYNFRMSAMQSALGLAQLERLDYLVAARQYIAAEYEAVIRETECDWLITPVVPKDYVHTYWTYVCKLDEEKLGADWREFKKVFIEQGGDGLYSAWRPVHLEPIFQTMEFFGSRERSPNFDPRYKGNVKSYNVGDCPVLEAMQPHLCQFKTSMQTLDRVQAQVEALRKTIRYFQGAKSANAPVASGRVL
jgi:perosamine synthetase